MRVAENRRSGVRNASLVMTRAPRVACARVSPRERRGISGGLLAGKKHSSRFGPSLFRKKRENPQRETRVGRARGDRVTHQTERVVALVLAGGLLCRGRVRLIGFRASRRRLRLRHGG